MHRARANARHNHTKLMKNTKNRTKKMKFVRHDFVDADCTDMPPSLRICTHLSLIAAPYCLRSLPYLSLFLVQNRNAVTAGGGVS